jgi:hypothetical protein
MKKTAENGFLVLAITKKQIKENGWHFCQPFSFIFAV